MLGFGRSRSLGRAGRDDVHVDVDGGRGEERGHDAALFHRLAPCHTAQVRVAVRMAALDLLARNLRAERGRAAAGEP